MLLTTKGKTEIIEQVRICVEEFQEIWRVNNEAEFFFLTSALYFLSPQTSSPPDAARTPHSPVVVLPFCLSKEGHLVYNPSAGKRGFNIKSN